MTMLAPEHTVARVDLRLARVVLVEVRTRASPAESLDPSLPALVAMVVTQPQPAETAEPECHVAIPSTRVAMVVQAVTPVQPSVNQETAPRWARPAILMAKRETEVTVATACQ